MNTRTSRHTALTDANDMKMIGAILLSAYMLAWWLVFYVPMRRENPLRALAFIPAAFFALAVPMLVSDALRRTPPAFMASWFVLPLVLVGVEVVWKRMRTVNPNKSRR